MNESEFMKLLKITNYDSKSLSDIGIIITKTIENFKPIVGFRTMNDKEIFFDIHFNNNLGGCCFKIDDYSNLIYFDDDIDDLVLCLYNSFNDFKLPLNNIDSIDLIY